LVCILVVLIVVNQVHYGFVQVLLLTVVYWWLKVLVRSLCTCVLCSVAWAERPLWALSVGLCKWLHQNASALALWWLTVPWVGVPGSRDWVMSTFWTLLLLLFRNSPTGEVRVKPVNGFSRLTAQATRTRARVCLLQVLLILGVKSLKSANFGGANRRFQAMGAKYWKFYVMKLLHWSQPNFALHNDTLYDFDNKTANINTKNRILSIMLSVTDQNPQKSLNM